MSVVEIERGDDYINCPHCGRFASVMELDGELYSVCCDHIEIEVVEVV